jgi:hypothetical protein
MESIGELAEAIIAQHRPRPLKAHRRSASPAMTYELTGDLRYRSFHVYDPAALLAPAENRIGRHIDDVLPIDIARKLTKCICRARRDRRSKTMRYEANDTLLVARVIVPSDDVIAVTVHTLR